MRDFPLHAHRLPREVSMYHTRMHYESTIEADLSVFIIPTALFCLDNITSGKASVTINHSSKTNTLFPTVWRLLYLWIHSAYPEKTRGSYHYYAGHSTYGGAFFGNLKLL